MLAVNYTNLRENMKNYMDKVTNDYETMIVTRKDNKNVVMMSEEAYNNLLENVHVMGNKANYDWLMESKEQLEKGNISAHELIEVDMNE
ncbi:type II toxin-antitoxin system Phd/YefM family antitoxin [Clostridium sp. 19966]|uniref:type II toxin-antitoxin system Phd/YefM family antitoxin n=1 Tax=Clostridium sp. 19966 TaxID=2768166 RepID=UPI0028DDB815|nr:type II toxin-antitoxin system Phd/YefM family antitoxin [Clostridium sp. 19966]MDT8715353.1 type II toxin-antitoxin system Phd/YefM family antitoxin [Clostridium sp. 19966]